MIDGAMRAYKNLLHCYDFPEIVIHKSSGDCGRYKKGGACRPLPTPVKPYTDDEKLAMEAYAEIMAHLEGRKKAFVLPKTALGDTILPGNDEYHD
jgi:hypothetical protein